jgi:hypothetical protein
MVEQEDEKVEGRGCRRRMKESRVEGVGGG